MSDIILELEALVRDWEKTAERARNLMRNTDDEMLAAESHAFDTCARQIRNAIRGELERRRSHR